MNCSKENLLDVSKSWGKISKQIQFLNQTGMLLRKT